MRYDRGSQNQDLHGRLRTIAAYDAAAPRAYAALSPPKQPQCKSAVAPPSDPMHESTHTTATRHAPRIAPMVALARGLGAACRISVARLRPAESDVRGRSSTRSKTVGAVRG